MLTNKSGNQDAGRVDDGVAELDKIIRRTFRLSQDYDLSSAGLGRTPSWDSLGHLQLIVAIEQGLGVSFTSEEIHRLMMYSDLRRIYELKRNQREAC
jgi:acyl carrier protein